MKFTDYQRNTEIELIGMGTCKLYIINGPKFLEGANRLFKAYARRAQLDGGDPVKFVHEVNAPEGYILMQGDIIEIIQSICDIDFISEQLQAQIIEAITSRFNQKARDSIHANYQPHFVATMRTCFETSLNQSPFTPPLNG